MIIINQTWSCYAVKPGDFLCFLFCFWQDLFPIKMLADINCTYVLESFIRCIACSLAGCLQRKTNTCPHDLIWCLKADTVLCCKKDMLHRLLLSKQILILLWKIWMFHLICHYHRKQEIPHWNSVYAFCFSLITSYFFFGCYITILIACLILHCLFL